MPVSGRASRLLSGRSLRIPYGNRPYPKTSRHRGPPVRRQASYDGSPFSLQPQRDGENRRNDLQLYGRKTDVWFTPCNAFETTVGKSRYSDRYNSAVQNDCATVFRQCQKFGSLITVVSIGKPVAVQKIPVTSTFKHITFPDSQIEGVSVDGWTVVISHYEWGSPPTAFKPTAMSDGGNASSSEVQTRISVPCWSISPLNRFP